MSRRPRIQSNLDPVEALAKLNEKAGSRLTKKSIINTATRGDEAKQSIATPWEFIHALEHRFGTPVDFDLAASPINAKATNYWTLADDALSRSWAVLDQAVGNDLRVPQVSSLAYLNPPFAYILPWAQKLLDCRWLSRWTTMLAPASFSSDWYRLLSGKVLVDPLTRIQFEGADKVYPKDLALFTAGFGVAGVNEAGWDWRVSYLRHCENVRQHCTIAGQPWPGPKARRVPPDDCAPDFAWTQPHPKLNEHGR